MNVIFTCGGTGGHIMPAIAVANIWKERHPDSKILFIGGKGNMEEELVPKAGYDLEVLPGQTLRTELRRLGPDFSFCGFEGDRRHFDVGGQLAEYQP